MNRLQASPPSKSIKYCTENLLPLESIPPNKSSVRIQVKVKVSFRISVRASFSVTVSVNFSVSLIG